MLIEAEEPAADGRRRDHLVQRREGSARARRAAWACRSPGQASSASGRSRSRRSNPLYLGPMLRNMRFPGEVDVHLNIGNRYGEMRDAGREAHLDPAATRRASRASRRSICGMVSRREARHGRPDRRDQEHGDRRTGLQQIADDRARACADYTKGMAQMRQNIAQELSGRHTTDHAGTARRASSRTGSRRTRSTSTTAIPARRWTRS